MRRQTRGAGLPAGYTQAGLPSEYTQTGLPAVYEEAIMNLLSTVSQDEIEKFKSGEISFIPVISENLEMIKNAIQSNPEILEQVKNASTERIIAEVKKRRGDIVFDEKLVERIRTELETVKKMIMDAVSSGGGDDGRYGF